MPYRLYSLLLYSFVLFYVIFSTEHLPTLVIRNLLNTVLCGGFLFSSWCALPRHLLRNGLPGVLYSCKRQPAFSIARGSVLICVRSALDFFVRTIDTAAGFSNQHLSLVAPPGRRLYRPPNASARGSRARRVNRDQRVYGGRPDHLMPTRKGDIRFGKEESEDHPGSPPPFTPLIVHLQKGRPGFTKEDLLADPNIAKVSAANRVSR